VVVVLGTNDVLVASGAPDLNGLHALVDALAWAPCVRWVTVTEASAQPALQQWARVVNEELERIVAARPGWALVPWRDLIAGHPDWLVADGIHHTEAGRAALADALTAALRTCAGVR
jgi:lysophospholipase L1-like esterase